MRFSGKLLDADEVIEFGLADMAAVYEDDDVMYIADGNTPIILSSVELVGDSRQTAEHQAVLIWAKLVYRWLSTYFAVPPGFMRDVPPAIIRER